MIRRLPPVRVPDAANEALEEGPLIVGYQVARQDHLPRRDELEAQVADQQNPFCQHDLSTVLEAGAESRAALPLTALAYQLLNATSGRGLGRADDSQVIRAFRALNGTDRAEAPQTRGEP